MAELIRRMWSQDEGQDLVEYALLVALISIVSVLALQTLGLTINGVWTAINTALTPAP